MPKLDLAHRRLANQHLSAPTFQKPEDVVAWLGAVQSQDYGGGKWAVALRTNDVTDAEMDKACDDGTILRTHVLRPTWHFVTPADIRWMLELTAPRIHALSAYNYRQVELDAAVFKTSNAIIVKTLREGSHCTREELAAALTRAGVPAQNNLRATHLVLYAELEGIICNGARRGKQHTYALLAERAPRAKSLPRDEALYELTKRYFTAHGPATKADYVWWSGLTATDAKKGIASCDALLHHEIINGETYYFVQAAPAPKNVQTISYLLPNYDEYIVGYTDRSAILDAVEQNKLDARGNVLFNNTIVNNGKVIGTWKRTLKKTSVALELNPFAPLTDTQTKSITAAAQRYGAFLGLQIVVNPKRDT